MAPNSSDMIPMAYFVWGAVEQDTNCTPWKSKAELISWIKVTFTNLSREVIEKVMEKACASFRGHIEDVIDTQWIH